MSRKPATYALLTAVGSYNPDLGLPDLTSFEADLDSMAFAFEKGLKIDADHIRKLGEDGRVPVLTFARSLAEFNSLLKEDDTFVLYFSGHGGNRGLVFTDGGITIQSILDYMKKLPAKCKLVILDCCYAGQAAPGSNPLLLEESVAAFAGTGIAVLASCAPDSNAYAPKNSAAADTFAGFFGEPGGKTRPAGRGITGTAAGFFGEADREARPEARAAGSGITGTAAGFFGEADREARPEARPAGSGACSLYTRVVCQALLSRRRIREGRLSLTGISEEIRCLMDAWNKSHPDLDQHPVYRENLIGTIYFPVEEYHPYIPQKVSFETEDYIVHHVKPLSTANLKRMAAFVILKKEDDSLLPRITGQIASQLLYLDIFSSEKSEKRFRGRPADVIWCYFGYDETDLVRGNHFAYTIWTGDARLRDTYYRENRNAEILDDIYVFWNSAYQTVKELQETDAGEEEIVSEYGKLSDLLIVHAEQLIKDMEEVENGTITYAAVKAANRTWIREVKTLFFKLTEAEVAPPAFHDRAEAILEMAGWIVDLALFLENRENMEAETDKWLLANMIGRYQLTLERSFSHH